VSLCFRVIEFCHGKCCYAVILNVIILSVMLNVIMLSVVVMSFVQSVKTSIGMLRGG
jgi:hypothetical protein